MCDWGIGFAFFTVKGCVVMIDLNELNGKMKGLDEAAVKASLDRWSQVAKPLKSLGALEDMVTQIAGIRGKARFTLKKRVLVVMCGDNGILAQGVTQTDESITTLVELDLAKGCSSANLMGNVAGCDVIAVDLGARKPASHPKLVMRHIADGTRDFTTGPAMTREQTLQAIETGIEMVKLCKNQGYEAIAVGEMGIGNTTTAAALTSVFLGCDPEEVTGRGAGLSTPGLKRKVDAIRRGIALNAPSKDDPLGTLAALGGFDIAGMVGLYIGCALYRLPVVIDGVVSAVSALVAQRLCPACAYAMLPSHMSSEPAAKKIFGALKLQPVLFAGLHLGEGTGALCLFPLLDMALSLYNGLVFSEIGMDAYTPQV